jgi:hypothetical protein
MYVVQIELSEAEEIADALKSARFEVLVAYDEMDEAFKVKIDGGTWSPPMGVSKSQSFTPPF